MSNLLYLIIKTGNKRFSSFAFAFFLLFLFSLTTPTLFAQNDSLEVEFEYDTLIVKRRIKQQFYYPDYKKGDVDVYASPFALLEICPTLSFGVEYFLKEKISVHTDVGYIFGLSSQTEQDPDININRPYSSFPNYVIKPEIRFYTTNNPQKASYHAIKFMFRNMNYKKNQLVFDEYFFDEQNQFWTPVGASIESDYRVRRRSIGIQYIRGWKGKLGKTKISNFYFGIGMRYIANQPIDKRPTPFDRGFGGFSSSLGIDILDIERQYKLITMDIALGFRIGTKIKRNPN